MPYIYPEGGGGGATTNIDTGARSLIAQLLATPGTTPDIAPGAGISADGRQWQNQTDPGIPLPIPTPANATTMATAGFTDVTAGGATDSLNTVGPWAGVANVGDEFGLDPATGDQYFVDNAGNWQPSVAGMDLNTTYVTVAGLAPAKDAIPASITSQSTRDDGDYEVQVYDDYRVAYRFGNPVLTASTEASRESLESGGVEVVPLNASAALSPSLKAGWRRVYNVKFSAPLVDVDGEDMPQVSVPVIAQSGLEIDVKRLMPEQLHLDMVEVAADGSTFADGAVMNIGAANPNNLNMITLTSVANIGWQVSQ